MNVEQVFLHFSNACDPHPTLITPHHILINDRTTTPRAEGYKTTQEIRQSFLYTGGCSREAVKILTKNMNYKDYNQTNGLEGYTNCKRSYHQLLVKEI